jgi:hypothetical protein
LVLLIGLLAVSLGGTARATQLWYDGFTTTDAGGDYVIGESGTPDLGGQSGGSGPGPSFFTGPWVAASYPASPPDNTKVFAASLSRPSQINPSIGGSASNTAHSDCCYEQRTSRVMSSPWSGFTNPDGTFYLSYLVNYGFNTTSDPQHRVFEMHDGGEDDSQRHLLLGFSSFVYPAGSVQQQLALLVDTAPAPVPLLVGGSPITLADTSVQGAHLMVLKFELSNSGNDVISAFIDPVGTVEPAANAVVSVADFTADRMSTIVQFAYTGLGQNASFDEMRVGTTFADVANNLTPYVGVPEPASISLLGLGALVLGLARRKRA